MTDHKVMNDTTRGSVVIENDFGCESEAGVTPKALPGVLPLQSVLSEVGPHQSRGPLEAFLDDRGAALHEIREDLLPILARLHHGEEKTGAGNGVHRWYLVHTLVQRSKHSFKQV